jgi:surfeit locus 1 family protein
VSGIEFRPLPALTAATLLALALLVSLGVWQLRRAEEKRALIARYEAVAASEVFAELYTPACLLSSGWVGRRVESLGAFAGAEVRFYGASVEGEPGWRILRLTPAPDCGCDAPAMSPEAAACVRADRSVVVEIGFETLDGARLEAPPMLSIAPPPSAGAFTPQNDPERGDFYRFEPIALARAFGVPPERVEDGLWLPAVAPGLPPGLADMPPLRHIGYALTWFGIAITLIGVYLAYHHRAGRLGRRA